MNLSQATLCLWPKVYRLWKGMVINMKEQTNTYANHKASDEQIWLRLMKLGEKTGCHQRCDRSFFYKGKQFPICARCTGVLIAYFISILRYIIVSCKRRSFRYPSRAGKKSHTLALLGCLSMLMDWTIQAVHVKESTNRRRLLTGFFGGLGLMHFYLIVYYKIGSYIIHGRKR